MTANNNTTKVQTAFRLERQLIGRLKEAARLANTSVNEYVASILASATEDIRSAAEKEEERRKTKAFLDAVSGKWSGEESAQELLSAIRDGRKERNIESL